MKACPICQSTYDESVDFCFKDGAPLEAADEDSGTNAATETLSALLQDDFEPPDAISLSNIPSVGDQSLPGASDADLLPPEPTFSNLKAVTGLDEAAETQVFPPAEDGTDLPEDDGTGLPEDPAGLPDDPAGLPPTPTGIPSSAAIGAADPAVPTADFDEADETIGDGVAPVGTGKTDAAAKTSAAAKPKGKKGKKAKVEVTAKPASKKRSKPTAKALAGSAVISARREPESKAGSKALLLMMGIAAVLLIGFIFMTLLGKDDGQATDEPTADTRGDALPPLSPPKDVRSGSNPDGEGANAARDNGSAAEGQVDATPADEAAPDANPEGASQADEGQTDESPAVADATPESVPAPADPTPAPTPDPTPAPVAQPTPAPEPTPASSAPEPPIAVVAAEPTPAPSPTPDSSPWGAGGEPTTLAPPADPANPWGATTATVTDGTLIVSSNPGGATVLVDGVSKGTTPLSVQLPFKSYEVRVSKDGHASQTRVVRVVGTKPINVDVALESLAPPASMAVIIASNPGGAVVYVDGARKGPTPLTVGMSVGNHEIKLEAPGLPACVRTLGVSANTRNAFYDLNTCN